MIDPTVLTSLAGILGGGTDAKPDPGPLPSVPLAAATPDPLPVQGQMPSATPMPNPVAPPSHKGGSWIRDLAPILLSIVAGRRDPIYGAAMLNGMTQGRLAADRERMAADQHQRDLQEKGAEFMRQTASDVLRLKDPLERQQYLQMAHDFGVQHFGLPDNWTQQIPAQPAGNSQYERYKGELSEQLAKFDKDARWKAVAGTPAEGKYSLKLSNGQTVPVNLARQLVGQAVFGSDGSQAYAPPEAPKPTTGNRQLKEVVINGRRTFVNYDPATGQMSDLQTGQPVTNARPIEPQTAGGNGPTPGAPGALDPDGLAYAATVYRLTGQMPSLGMGKNPDRARIINLAASQAKVLKQTPAMAVQRQFLLKGDAQSLNRITLLASTAEAAESKAAGQIDIIRELSGKVKRTQYPILNRAILSGQTSIAGDPDATALMNAISTFAQEYGKIIEGSTGSVAGSSDASRSAAGRLVNAAMNPQQLARVLDLMQREMDLTIQGYGVTKAEIARRMGESPAPSAAPAPGSSGLTIGRFKVQVGGGQ